MSVRLGRVQLRIMQVLWEKRRATAKEITDALNADEPTTHSTVQTLLRGLEAKQAIGHQVEGRTFIFFPLIKEGQIASSVTLAWDPSPSSDVAGYNLYYGPTSRTYTNMINAGSVTNVTVSGLAAGVCGEKS